MRPPATLTQLLHHQSFTPCSAPWKLGVGQQNFLKINFLEQVLFILFLLSAIRPVCFLKNNASTLHFHRQPQTFHLYTLH